MAKTKADYEALGLQDKNNGTTDNRPMGKWQLEAYNKGYASGIEYSSVAASPKPKAPPPEPKRMASSIQGVPRRLGDLLRRAEATVLRIQHKQKMHKLDVELSNSQRRRRWA